MTPNGDLATDITDLYEEINSQMVAITDVKTQEREEVNDSFPVNKTNVSVYGTPSEFTATPVGRRSLVSPGKHFKNMTQAMEKLSVENQQVKLQLKEQAEKIAEVTKTNEMQVKMFNETLSKMTSMLQTMMTPQIQSPIGFPPGSPYAMHHAMQMHAMQQAMHQSPQIISSSPVVAPIPAGAHPRFPVAPVTAQNPPMQPQMQPSVQQPIHTIPRAQIPRPAQQIGQFPPIIQTAPPPQPKPVQAPQPPVVSTPTLPPPVTANQSAPPRFTFNQTADTIEKSKPLIDNDNPKPFTFGHSNPTSTPARPAGSKFVFKSPEVADKENAKLDEDEKNEQDAEGDAGPHFEPIIPLPDLVDVKTGEEDEETLFTHRGKLYRWNDKQWKERGLGDMKILKAKNGKCRILMRREQVHKICANHLIQKEMKLTPMGDKNTAWIWSAMDGSDETTGTIHLKVKVI